MVLKPLSDGSALRGLYSTFSRHRAHVGSAIAGAIPAKFLADDERKPTCAIVEPESGFSYLALAPRADADGFLEACSVEFSRRKDSCVELISDARKLDSALERAMGDRPHFPVERIRYEPGELASFELPAGLAIASELSGDPASGYASLALLDAERELGRCSAWLDSSYAEVDLSIEEEARGRGYGSALASAFLKWCAELGIKAEWTCWADNVASNALAKKLGMVEASRFPVLISDPAS
jgi:GNAT superfamily N-acetyltransferase